MLVLCSDDIFNEVGVTTPPFSTFSGSNDIEIVGNYDFNTQPKSVWLPIEKWLHQRNQLMTYQTSKNLNGKSIGDYTCGVLDVSTGKKFFAQIKMKRTNGKDTRFWNGTTWEKDACTFSLEVQQVVGP